MGVSTFSTPAPMTFPNVFNAPPGTKLNLLRFNEDTGRFKIVASELISYATAVELTASKASTSS
jgi:hypothetical protein